MYRVNDVLELNDARVVIVAEALTASTYRVRKLDLANATPSDLANLFTTIDGSLIKRKVGAQALFPRGERIQAFDQRTTLGGDVCLGASVEWLLRGTAARLAHGVDHLDASVCTALQAKLEGPCVAKAEQAYAQEGKASASIVVPKKPVFEMAVTRDGVSGRVKAIQGTPAWSRYQGLLADERCKVMTTHLDAKALVPGASYADMSDGDSEAFFTRSACAASAFAPRFWQIVSLIGTSGGHALAIRAKSASLFFVFDPLQGVFEVPDSSLSSWLLDHLLANYGHLCGYCWLQFFTLKATE